MKARAILVSLIATSGMMAFGQRPAMELTFTAENNGSYVQLDSIKVMNRTQWVDTVLRWPDTVLSLYYVGIDDPGKQKSGFRVDQNYPNPVTDQTTISMFIPGKDNVVITITDISGRVILRSEQVLDKGTHTFRFIPGNGGLFLFSVQWCRERSSIKIQHNASYSYWRSSLEYLGREASFPQLKATEDVQDFVFGIGDELLYIGYANGLQSGMLDAPEENQTYTFQFATNIPCPGMPTVEYEGQVYNTIQVFSQCWLKENLNVGGMIPGTMEQSNNGTIEKYCYNNEPDSCSKFGGFYQWWEMMQYTTQPGAQGICPPGWHLPEEEEWKVLEGSVDSQFGIGDTTWDLTGYRGLDAGTNLKNTSGWYENGNGTDLFGFSGPPGGGCYGEVFSGIGYEAHWWASTERDLGDAWGHDLGYGSAGIGRGGSVKFFGYSARCLRDAVSFVPAGAVAYWNFNDTPDEQISGAAPSGIIDLEYEDSYKTSAGKAARFNGTSTIVEFADGDLWMNTSDFTLSFWVKTGSAGHVNENGDPKGHFTIGLGAFYGFQFEISADYSWCKLAASYELEDGTTASEDLWFPGDGLTGQNGGWQGWTFCKDLTGSGGVAALLKDTWASVVCVYDSETREGTMYINGEKMKAQDFDLWPDGDPKRGVVGLKYGGVPPDVVNELAFGFIQSRAGTMWDDETWGGYDFPTSNHFGGWLDDVRIFHKALTADEVNLMYQSEKP